MSMLQDKRRIKISESKLRGLVGSLLIESYSVTTLQDMEEAAEPIMSVFAAILDRSEELRRNDPQADKLLSMQGNVQSMVKGRIEKDLKEFLSGDDSANNVMISSIASHLAHALQQKSFVDGYDQDFYMGFQARAKFDEIMADYLPRWRKLMQRLRTALDFMMHEILVTSDDTRKRLSAQAAGLRAMRAARGIIKSSLRDFVQHDPASFAVLVDLVVRCGAGLQLTPEMKSELKTFRQYYCVDGPSRIRGKDTSNAKVSRDEIIEHLVQQTGWLVKQAHTRGEDIESELMQTLKILPVIVEELASNMQRQDNERIEDFAKAPPGAPLGRIAFSPERKQRDPKIPFEANTKIEDKLRDALIGFIGSNIDVGSSGSQLVQQLMADGQYDDIIIRTSGKSLYRGMLVNHAAFSKLVGRSTDEVREMMGSREGTFEVSMKFEPRKESGWSSWTDHRSIALKFAKLEDDPDFVCIILHADADENNFFDFSELYDNLPGIHSLKSEREHVGIGSIKVNKIEIVNCGYEGFE